MRRFLRDVSVFSLGLLAWLGTMYAINTGTSALNTREIRSDVLIVGDSHTRQSLNPEIFVSAQNISQPAEPYYVTYWKLKRLLTDSSVDTVLLGFSHHNLSAFNDRKLSDGRWSAQMFRRIYPIEEFDSLQGIEIDFREFYRAKFRRMCLVPRWNHDAYIGDYRSWERTDLSTVDPVIARHFYYEDENVGVSETSLAFLDSIVALSARENVKLILVTPPVHSSYYERIPENFTVAFEEKKHELEGGGIPVLDYGRLAVPDDEFLNADHLNRKGATGFSRLVSARLADLEEREPAID